MRWTWNQAMAFGIGALGLSARDFWSLTPRELQAAVDWHGGTTGTRPTRETLDAMMLRYPDREKTKDGTSR